MKNSINQPGDNKNIKPSGNGMQSNPDPIVQARDYSDKTSKAKQSSEIIIATEQTRATPSVTAWPNQFMGPGGPAHTVPVANDLIRSMLRFKWTLIIIFLLVSAPAIALIWTQIIPQYRARAELRIRPSVPRLVFRTDENGAIPFYDSFVNTQVSIIRSPTVLQRVLDQEDVKNTQWYKSPQKSLVQKLKGNIGSPLERLRDALSVQPRRRTEIIDIDFMDVSASDAKIIVNAVLEQYRKHIGTKSDEDQDKLYKQLSEEYRSLDEKIKGHESTIADLKEKMQTANPQALIDNKRIRLDETKDRLNELERNIALLELLNTPTPPLEDANNVAFTRNPEIQLSYEEDEEWLRRDIDVRTLRYRIASCGLTPKHQDRRRMEKDLEFAEELRQLREMQLDKLWRERAQDISGIPTTTAQWRDQSINVLGAPIDIPNTDTTHLGQNFIPVNRLGNQPLNVLGGSMMTTNDMSALSAGIGLVSVEQQLAQAKHEEELLAEHYDKQQKEFEELFLMAQTFEKENSDLAHERELFEAVRQQRDQKDMERKVSDVIATVEVLTDAFASSKPSNDRRVVFTAMALAMGLGMSGGIAFLRASRNQTVYTLKDMPYPFQIPLLGRVPIIDVSNSLQRLSSKTSDKKRYAQDSMTESIRLVRTTLLARMERGEKAAVLITSASPGTGKSHFTMTLGESFARAGKKVLLIDADLRKRTLTQRANLAEKPGFVESLCSKSVNKRHIFPTETVGLSIMPSGQWKDNEAFFEQTANGVFKTCIAQLRQDYDIILLDSPPIMPVADSTILSSQVDGTIMVERELVSHREDLTDALTRLISSGGRLLGTVFVGSQDRKDYGYTYAYGQA